MNSYSDKEYQSNLFHVVTSYPEAPIERICSLDYTYSLENVIKDTPPNKHRNLKFNEKINKLIPNKPLFILDLGCSGGSFISDCINDGHLALGFEGFHIYKKYGILDWHKYQNNFHLLDITKPWEILYNGKPIQLDLITSWEFMEHLNEIEVKFVIDKISQYLKPNGYTIHSISTDPNESCHLTIQKKEWWVNEFKKRKIIEREDLYNEFNGTYIRLDVPGSFYFIGQKENV